MGLTVSFSLMCRHVGLWLSVVVALMVLPNVALASYEKGLEAYQSSDVKTAVAAWTEAANDGDPRAQFELGKLYEQGLGVLQDLIEAHRWYNLAASSGVIDAVAARNAVEQKMSADEVKAARQRAAQWKPGQATASGTGQAAENPTPVKPAPPATPQPTGRQALWQAAEAGDVEAIRAAIADGTDVNAKDKDGWTALMFAAVSQQTDAVAALLEAGADPNIATGDGSTPLMGAAATGNSTIVNLLVDANADLAAKDSAGRTAGELASKAGHQGAAALLSPKVIKPAKPTFDPQVQEAQRLLAQLGYSPGPADGVMGSRTKNAIRGFQRDTNSEPDGKVSEGLIAVLDVRARDGRATSAGGRDCELIQPTSWGLREDKNTIPAGYIVDYGSSLSGLWDGNQEAYDYFWGEITGKNGDPSAVIRKLEKIQKKYSVCFGNNHEEIEKLIKKLYERELLKKRQSVAAKNSGPYSVHAGVFGMCEIIATFLAINHQNFRTQSSLVWFEGDEFYWYSPLRSITRGGKVVSSKKFQMPDTGEVGTRLDLIDRSNGKKLAVAFTKTVWIILADEKMIFNTTKCESL